MGLRRHRPRSRAPWPRPSTRAGASPFGAFGLHLILLGAVGLKAPYLPKLLGGLLVLSGVGYLAGALGPLFWPGYPLTVALYTFAGEILLGLWLVVKGWRLPA